jgi:hypothetical protein
MASVSLALLILQYIPPFKKAYVIRHDQYEHCNIYSIFVLRQLCEIMIAMAFAYSLFSHIPVPFTKITKRQGIQEQSSKIPCLLFTDIDF